MRNIDKLVKFLVTDSDKDTLSKSTATDIVSVGKFTDYVIDRILPEDFLIQEGSHVEEKDLNSLVRNFNSLLKEDNLKPIIIEGMNRAQIKPNQASALMSNLLPIIHEKIKILMGSASNKKAESQKQEEVSEEELLLLANRWELRHGGVSGRTAQQFINYLAGKEPDDHGNPG